MCGLKESWRKKERGERLKSWGFNLEVWKQTGECGVLGSGP